MHLKISLFFDKKDQFFNFTKLLSIILEDREMGETNIEKITGYKVEIFIYKSANLKSFRLIFTVETFNLM